MVVVRARAWLGLGSVVAPPAPRSAHLSCHGRNWSPHRFLASRRGRLAQGYLGWTCTARGPVHAVGKESCVPPYCAPSPTRTYLGTGGHLGERRRASKGAVLARGVQYMPLSGRVSSPWHLAQVVLSLSLFLSRRKVRPFRHRCPLFPPGQHGAQRWCREIDARRDSLSPSLSGWLKSRSGASS